MAFDEVCSERLSDALFDSEERKLEGTDPRLVPPGVHGRLETLVTDRGLRGDFQGMSVAPRRDGSGTPAIKSFFDFCAWDRDWMCGLMNALKRAVLLPLFRASRSNPLKETLNRYQCRYQDVLRELTSSLTPAPHEFANFVEKTLLLGRRVRDGIMQQQAKDWLLDVVAPMKIDGLRKKILKEEIKVALEFNYLEMIIFVMNQLMSRHKLEIKKVHIV